MINTCKIDNKTNKHSIFDCYFSGRIIQEQSTRFLSGTLPEMSLKRSVLNVSQYLHLQILLMIYSNIIHIYIKIPTSLIFNAKYINIDYFNI